MTRRTYKNAPPTPPEEEVFALLRSLDLGPEPPTPKRIADLRSEVDRHRAANLGGKRGLPATPSREFLRRSLSTLYGERFKPAAARAMEVEPITLWRWCTGKTDIPEYVWPRLFKLLDAKMREVHALTDECYDRGFIVPDRIGWIRPD